MPADETHLQQDWFVTTRWSVVMNAARNETPASGAALEQLCQVYWPPIYTYMRRRGHDAEQAKDLTQEFFRQLLERNTFAVADRNKGKFRSFLLASANHFLANEWQRANALKRGGGKIVVSLNDPDEQVAPADPASEPPELAFDRRWAFTLLKRSLATLEEEFRKAGKEPQFQKLSRYLTDPSRDEDYATIAAEFQVSPATIAVWVHRMRQRYRDIVRAEIAETVSTASEVDEEIRYLFSILT